MRAGHVPLHILRIFLGSAMAGPRDDYPVCGDDACGDHDRLRCHISSRHGGLCNRVYALLLNRSDQLPEPLLSDSAAQLVDDYSGGESNVLCGRAE